LQKVVLKVLLRLLVSFGLENYACSGNITLREKNAILQNVVKQELEKLAVFSAFNCFMNLRSN
jgi:hypothetical protein